MSQTDSRELTSQLTEDGQDPGYILRKGTATQMFMKRLRCRVDESESQDDMSSLNRGPE